ncbi:MAG: hypothetical protein M3T96_08365 [Acidobacteriota bacterium]|nr:hypothetical protein [Acidobacteriota bacterium]
MPDETKNDQEKVPAVTRDGWNTKKLSEESTNQSADEMMRQVLRGDETNGDPDGRDIVGGSDSGDTAQGREESKQDKTKSDS